MSQPRSWLLFLSVLMLLLAGCEQPPPRGPHITMKDELIPYLDSLELQYEAACRTVGMANWNSYSKEAPYDLNTAKAELARLFLDTTARKIIEEWRGRSGSLADATLARRLELWHRCFLGGSIYADPEIARLENDLQQRITNYKFTLDGNPTTRAQASTSLRQTKRQPERMKLWRVPAQVSRSVDRDLIRLVKLRNAKARALGYDNYYSLSLSLNAINEEWLLRTMNYLEEKTLKPFEEFRAVVKKKLKVKEVGPWDYDFALAQSVALPDKYFPSDSVFTLIHRFSTAIGFDVDSLPIKEVVKDIPYGGLSLAIRIPGDSRFLVNPYKGKNFYALAFHEYGHSLKAVHTDVPYAIFKGYEWLPGAQCGAYEEGVAEMYAEFTEDSAWLDTYTKARVKEIVRYVEGRGAQALYRLRRMLKDFYLEYEIYHRPDSNVAGIEREMFKTYLLADLDEREPHQYASTIWYTTYPCYYQNYILSAMVATQLQEALTNKFGENKSTDSTAAAWIIEHLYRHGETEEWGERIRNATGKSLEPGAYLRKLGIEPVKLITKKEEE
jgi:peptidyl-dipeptidase A